MATGLPIINTDAVAAAAAYACTLMMLLSHFYLVLQNSSLIFVIENEAKCGQYMFV